MTSSTLSSRQFNLAPGKAKKAANKGPVFITDRGHPAHVLLTIDEYRRLAGSSVSIADALAMPGGEDIEFDPPKADIRLRIPDFE